MTTLDVKYIYIYFMAARGAVWKDVGNIKMTGKLELVETL